jgi:hypothetical protein
MSKQLISKIEELEVHLDLMKSLALSLPEASDEIEYAVVNSGILIYIPYALHILAEWQERLNRLGFTRADPFCSNEYGITVHEGMSRDCCRMIVSPTSSKHPYPIHVSLWLCPDHPKATIKKGAIPQL